MIIRNGRKIGHGGIDLGPADDEKADADLIEFVAERMRANYIESIDRIPNHGWK